MTIKLELLQSNKGSRRKKLRKGRGIAAGQGASCGFGMRGQKSRSGRPTRPGFEGGQMPLYRRVPKLKHFPLVNQKHFSVLNVSDLNSLKEGTLVNLDLLVKEGLLTKPKHPLKILGNGELKVKLTVQATAFTSSAKQKIEAAGGTFEVFSESSNE
jgi:large subunit ribosomal protein L15